MISIIIFIAGVLVSCICSLAKFLDSMSWWLILIIVISSVVGMILINGVVAIVCSKLIPNKCFHPEKKFYMPTKKECKFYEKIGIKKWKDRTLEMGFLNGFPKDKVVNSPEYIERFILEDMKGYLTHFVSLFASVLAIFILPMKFWLTVSIPVIVTSLILNIIPMMILRYNMPRLKTMLKFSLRNVKK